MADLATNIVKVLFLVQWALVTVGTMAVATGVGA